MRNCHGQSTTDNGVHTTPGQGEALQLAARSPVTVLELHVPPGTPADVRRRVLLARRSEIAQQGPQFAAYLTLPDVDATRDDLVQRCDSCYVGDFADMEEVVDKLTSAPAWQVDLDWFAAERGLTGLVRLDLGALHEICALNWDIAEMGGRLYVFDK